MSLQDVLREELIGTTIIVVDARNKANMGLTGKVVDETKNMLIVEQDGIIKRLIKDHIVIRITIKGKPYEINGKLLIGRPEDRLKKHIKL